MRALQDPPYSRPVPPATVAIVSDAHLGHAPDSTGIAFHAFLGTLPDLADHLVINGDLFDFWFEYRRVIPRRAFSTLAALSAARSRGVQLTVIGGNHDRWGGGFWVREMGAAFHADGMESDLGGRRAFVAHGDGLAESRWVSRVMHRVTRNPLAVGLFRLLHPDLGFWLADRMSGALAEQTRTAEAVAKAGAAQTAFAADLMARRPELDVVVLGHTHHPVLKQVGDRRWYVNPGAWMLGHRYALLTADGPVLRSFEGSR